MAKQRQANTDQVEELLQKLLVLQAHDMGMSQDRIAKFVGRQKLWANDILKGISRKGADG